LVPPGRFFLPTKGFLPELHRPTNVRLRCAPGGECRDTLHLHVQQRLLFITHEYRLPSDGKKGQVSQFGVDGVAARSTAPQ
jgi:hypothetical protein